MFDIKQIQKMQKELQDRMAQVQGDLKNQEVEGTAGGGMVVARANGNQELTDLVINRDVVDPEDIEMLQDLVVAAVNNALDQARELNQNEMSKVTGGIKIPGLF
jgi:DNA-binding YbaB/EbfC family protein